MENREGVSSAVGQAAGAAPGVLDPGRRAALVAALNRIIPARVDVPGAGDLGVGDSVERAIATTPSHRRLFLDGLDELELESARVGGRAFVELDREAQDAALQTVQAARPAFFAALVDLTYRGYYLLPRVHVVIGYESRPPQPRGYALPVFDPALLTTQRGRTPFWRRTS